MDQFEQMKVTRQAMNGKMCLMFGGIFLMFSAITSTIMYGINFFMTALEASQIPTAIKQIPIPFRSPLPTPAFSRSSTYSAVHW